MSFIVLAVSISLLVLFNKWDNENENEKEA